MLDEPEKYLKGQEKHTSTKEEKLYRKANDQVRLNNEQKSLAAAGTPALYFMSGGVGAFVSTITALQGGQEFYNAASEAFDGEYHKALKSAGMGSLDLLAARGGFAGLSGRSVSGLEGIVANAGRIGLREAETAIGVAKADSMATSALSAVESSPKITITRAEPVKPLPNGGAPYLNESQALLAKNSVINESEGFPSGISFNINWPKHLSEVENLTGSKGVVGGHNMHEFEKFAAENSFCISSKTEITKGIYKVEYQHPSKNRDGSLDGGYKSLKTKTVYNPNVYSDSDMVSMGQAAAAKKYYSEYIQQGKSQYNSEYNGIDFRVYVDKIVV